MKKDKSLLRRVIFLVIAISLHGILLAQTKTITGVVKDATGEVIIGASISAKGTTTGTISKLDGTFSISVPETVKSLVFSYIGMKKQEVQINGKVMMITLESDSKVLDEVVAIGYGTTKKRDLTGSVSSISGKDLIANPVANVAEALQGHLAGVNVMSQDGRPGASVSIKVRGGGSITQSNDPVFIVDGFPVSDISDIPADRIESIDVLKDASSTAIYGARGANGVILVTTKNAKDSKTSISYSSYFQSKSVARTLKTIENAQDYVGYTWAYAGLLGNTATPTTSSNFPIGTTFFGLGTNANAAANWATYGTMKTHNYSNDLLRSAFSQNHNLSISGGSDKTKILFDVNYLDDPGIRINSGYDRWNASLKVSHELNKRMKLNLNLAYMHSSTNGKNDVGNLATAYQYRAIEPLGDGSNYSGWGNGDNNVSLSKNIVNIVNNITQINKDQYISGQGTFIWEIIKGLKLTDDLGLKKSTSEDKYWDNGYNSTKNAKLTQGDGYSLRNAVTLNYQMSGLGKDHSMNILAGQEVLMSQSNSIFIGGGGYPSSFGFNDAFGLITMTDGGQFDKRSYTIGTPSRTQSWFGRVNYTFLDRYLLTATFRADASTKFAPNNRWGYFPAAALGWRVIDEPFMASAKSWVDNLKVKVSYGQSGADNISPSLWKDTWTQSTATVSGATVYTFTHGSILPNPDLKWETTISRNLGIDFGFWNRLNGTLDFYNNTNKNLLLAAPIDATTGYSYQYVNAGQTSNKGVELSLNLAIAKSKNFNLKVGLNYNYNLNRIDQLAPGLITQYGQIWGSTLKSPLSYDYQLIVGRSAGTLMGAKNLGYYTLNDFNYDATAKSYTLKSGVADFPLSMNYPGQKLFNLPTGQKAFPGCLKVATNADGTTQMNQYDMRAKHTGGFNFTGNFKNFDFSTNFTWQIGGKVYNAQAMADFFGNKDNSLGTNHYSYFQNTFKMWEVKDGQMNYYTDPDNLARLNANATYALPTFENGIILDNWIEDASYLRLSTLTIGYTLPKLLTKKAGIENVRIYATGGNLFCLTGYSGLDPEVGSITSSASSAGGTSNSNVNFPTPGVDYSSYPRARTFTVGLNVTF
jgi:TonB-linked SusC/RagA family outer membrane protein